VTTRVVVMTGMLDRELKFIGRQSFSETLLLGKGCAIFRKWSLTNCFLSGSVLDSPNGANLDISRSILRWDGMIDSFDEEASRQIVCNPFNVGQSGQTAPLANK
jgi:hypothetical protein